MDLGGRVLPLLPPQRRLFGSPGRCGAASPYVTMSSLQQMQA